MENFKLGSRALLESINHFHKFADHILPLSNITPEVAPYKLPRANHLKKSVLTFNWNISQSRLPAREKRMWIELGWATREKSLKIIDVIGLGKTFCNKMSFISVHRAIRFEFHYVYLTIANNGNTRWALTKSQVIPDTSAYISSSMTCFHAVLIKHQKITWI